VLELVNAQGIDLCIDGGWGVDALVGEQTRPHDDLDVVIDSDDIGGAIEVLARADFELAEDERPTRFVMSHPDGRSIDFHPVTFDAEGGGVQQLHDGGTYRYPPEGLQADGTIGGHRVRCIDAATQLECHQGYEIDPKGRHDLAILSERLGVG
jgi:lincosamide nucleotidyltransferase A/C/D/E